MVVNPMLRPSIVISATFTADAIEQTLSFWMRELGFDYRIRMAPYNQVFQLLLDPAGALASNRDGVNVVLVRFEDWAHAQNGAAPDLVRLEADIQHFAASLNTATNGQNKTHNHRYDHLPGRSVGQSLIADDGLFCLSDLQFLHSLDGLQPDVDCGVVIVAPENCPVFLVLASFGEGHNSPEMDHVGFAGFLVSLKGVPHIWLETSLLEGGGSLVDVHRQNVQLIVEPCPSLCVSLGSDEVSGDNPHLFKRGPDVGQLGQRNSGVLIELLVRLSHHAHAPQGDHANDAPNESNQDKPGDHLGPEFQYVTEHRSFLHSMFMQVPDLPVPRRVSVEVRIADAHDPPSERNLIAWSTSRTCINMSFQFVSIPNQPPAFRIHNQQQK